VLRVSIFLGISKHAFLIQSPNFTDSGNMELNKINTEIEFLLILILLLLLKY